MTDARDIIAGALRQASGTGESCEMKARWISEALTAAGYRILAPDALDPVTLKRTAEVAASFDQRADILKISGCGVAAAIRSLASGS